MGEPRPARGPRSAGAFAGAAFATALAGAGCSVIYDFDPGHLPGGRDANAGATEAGVTDAGVTDAAPPDVATCPGADLARDDENCGACARRCGSSQRCRGGVCACNGGGGNNVACGAECVDLNNSARHCGACGLACGAAAPECCSGTCRARCNP